MTREKIDQIVEQVVRDYCEENDIKAEVTQNTHLIGASSIMDSVGLVSTVVDIESALLEEGVDISLTSETPMSARISPFRTIGSLCSFIERELEDGKA